MFAKPIRLSRAMMRERFITGSGFEKKTRSLHVIGARITGMTGSLHDS
jgi:hypothetical protein